MITYSTVFLRSLLDRGEENYIFHRGLQCAILKLSPGECKEAFALSACELPSGCLRAAGRLGEKEIATLIELYAGLREKFVGSPAAARIPLTLLEGDALRSSLGELLYRSGSGGCGRGLGIIFYVVFRGDPFFRFHQYGLLRGVAEKVGPTCVPVMFLCWAGLGWAELCSFEIRETLEPRNCKPKDRLLILCRGTLSFEP